MTQEAIALRTTGGAYPGLSVVQDVNKANETIATDFAGAADPAALAGAYMTWADTGNMLLKRRNGANTAWVVEGKLLVDNSSAANVSYDNAASGLPATNVQAAIDQIAITRSTLITASGTNVDFTGIPASAKRVTLNFNGVSTAGATSIFVVLGSASGFETTGYLSASTSMDSSVSTTNPTAGFEIKGAGGANIYSGGITLDSMSGNAWIGRGQWGLSNAAASFIAVGSKTLAGALDRVRVITASGVDTFDAGTLQLSWES